MYRNLATPARTRLSALAGALIALGSMACLCGSALAQQGNLPFTVQSVGDQVVNGVVIRGGTVPVWTDQSGRPAGQMVAQASVQAVDTDQAELDELAQIGKGEPGISSSRRRLAAPIVSTDRAPADPAPAAKVTGPQSATLIKNPSRGPKFDIVDEDGQPVTPAEPRSATLRKKPRSEEEEISALESKLTALKDEYAKKQREIEDKKRDAERRAEEKRQQAERERARKLLIFEAKEGHLLSEAIQLYAGKNGWENVEWNVGADFRIRYAYSEIPQQNDSMKEVLLRVLKPYKLSAEMYRPNSVIEIYSSSDRMAR